MLTCPDCKTKNTNDTEQCITCGNRLSPKDIEEGASTEPATQGNDTAAATAASPELVQHVGDKFDRNKFLVNQKRMSFKEKYYVYGEDEKELFYVERDFKFMGKRNITVFDDDTKSAAVLQIDQDHRWEFRKREYTLYDAAGEPIASFYRDNWKSLFRRSWDIFDRHGTLIAIAREDSVGLAILRRIIDFIPFVELLGGLIKTDFHLFRINAKGEEEKIGSFNRRMTFADKYVLDLSGDPGRTLDRRTALALGILLDTAEKR